MAHFGLKIGKSESPDKVPYTVYYPHTMACGERKWTQPWYQIVSIDPARKNYAMRIERRYHNGWITPIVFDKVSIESIQEQDNILICHTYEVLTTFLDKYQQFYNECHFIIIERQLPQNYKATRIAQHSISYFSIRLHNLPLLPSIVEVDPKLKGKTLGAPKNITDKQLKTWAVEKARELLTIRKDQFSLDVLNHFRNKQDDLSDTVCQAEALFICWGLLPTISPPSSGINTPSQQSKPTTLQLTPTIVMDVSDTMISVSEISNTQSTSKQLTSLIQTAPLRTSPLRTSPFRTSPLISSQTAQVNVQPTQVNNSVNVQPIQINGITSNVNKIQVVKPLVLQLTRSSSGL
jgi:hypothetical protein